MSQHSRNHPTKDGIEQTNMDKDGNEANDDL